MENDIQKVLAKLDGHGKQFDTLNQRFDKLEASMNKGFEETADQPPIENGIIGLGENFYAPAPFGQQATGRV